MQTISLNNALKFIKSEIRRKHEFKCKIAECKVSISDMERGISDATEAIESEFKYIHESLIKEVLGGS